MSEPSQAVFLSYASQDAAAAQRICEALRAAGIEVWFDQSELRGGDVWDQTIRKQIKACALFIPVISRHTHDRDEGYFRLEWKIAVDRSHLMASDRTFLLPVVIDHTPEDDERVPDKFRDVHWTRLPAGETPSAFVERVKRLLSPQKVGGVTASPGSTTNPIPSSGRTRTSSTPLRRSLPVVIAGLMVVAMLAYLVIERPWLQKRGSAAPTSTERAAVPAGATRSPSTNFSPPPHSIAVLPFVNMSGDKDQEYFSEGLTEELLNSLSRIDELQVAARTSSFSFQGEHPDIATVAHKLNVGAVLEGSVRRSAHTIRISAQLINAVTGFRLWSQTYDRDLGDVLKLQSDIAAAVASALKVTLLADTAARIEVGGTRNPAAFDAYLRASKAFISAHAAQAYLGVIAAYTDVIRLDSSYALAYAARSFAQSRYAGEFATGAAIRDNFDRALADANRAIALAPEMVDGHLALGFYLETGALDFSEASKAYVQARELAPGSVRALRTSGYYAAKMGHFDAGVADLRRAVALDPLNPTSRDLLGTGLYAARRYDEAIAAFTEAVSLEPDFPRPYAYRGLAYYELGDFSRARVSCEAKPAYWGSLWCLAVTYEKLGRRSDAQGALGKLEAAQGDAAAYQYSTIYAQWGDTRKALEWLGTAVRLRDPGLGFLKTDALMDPLRREPRFQAIERSLKFPE